MESCQYQPHLAVSAAEKEGLGYCSSSSELGRGDCRVLDVEMELGESHGCREGDRDGGRDGHADSNDAAASLASEAAESGGSIAAQLPFSKELITFSLFGKIPIKHSKQRSY